MNPFARIEQLLGPAALEKIWQARVAVFGLGAVGSFTIEALARSGVGHLQIVDFDRVDASNINRQLLALNSTIGKSKAALAKDRIKDINPACRVSVHDTFVNSDSIDTLLSRDIDVVVDAIDGLNSKVNLLIAAKNMNLPVISSMGAAGRIDPSMIRVGDISKTSVCPLARVVRRRLHRRGVFDGISCVYSIEHPRNKQAFQPEDAVDTLKDHGRSRPPIGSIVWVPGIFGLTLAGQAVQMLVPDL